MDAISFLYLSVSDLLMGIFIIAPLIYLIEWGSGDFVKLPLSGTLRHLSVNEPTILLVLGLLWALITTLSDNTGLSWIW
jgi:hypothetical protein